MKNLILTVLLATSFVGCNENTSSKYIKAASYDNIKEISIKAITRILPDGYALDVTKNDNILYVAAGTKGVFVYEIKTPKEIVYKNTILTDIYVDFVEISDKLLYAGRRSYEDYATQIYKYEIKDEDSVDFIGEIEKKYDHSYYETDTLVYFINNNSLKILRKSDSAILTEYSFGETPYNFYVDGDYIYVADGLTGVIVLETIKKY